MNAKYTVHPTPRLTTIQRLDELRKEYHELTAALAGSPFNPVTWHSRSEIMLELGFPELALGDVLKARLLVGDALKSQYSPPSLAFYNENYKELLLVRENLEEAEGDFHGSLLKLEVGIMTHFLECLDAADCLYDLDMQATAATELYPGDPEFLRIAESAKSRFQERLQTINSFNQASPSSIDPSVRATLGFVPSRPYPWMTRSMFQRSDQFIASINEALGREGIDCVIKRTSLTSDPANEQVEVGLEGNFGVFATKKFRPGEEIFVDKTALCATNDLACCHACCGAISAQSKKYLPCCRKWFCSSECIEMVSNTFHDVLCGKEDEFLEEIKGTGATQPEMEILMLRVLATAFKQSPSNPLHAPIIVQLVPQYTQGITKPITLPDMMNYLRMLEALRVNIYSNLNYDIWVLHTIRLRIINNARGKDRIMALNPRFTFFNHSCEPKVDWDDERNDSSLSLSAARTIRKGEEMFISYIGDSKYLPESYDRRNHSLQTWLPGDCLCSRCKREKKEEKELFVRLEVQAQMQAEKKARQLKHQEAMELAKVEALAKKTAKSLAEKEPKMNGKAKRALAYKQQTGDLLKQEEKEVTETEAPSTQEDKNKAKELNTQGVDS